MPLIDNISKQRIIFKYIEKYHLALWRWIAASDPPQTTDLSLTHSIANTFYCSAWIFCRGKLHLMSQILRVLSWDPEEKLFGSCGLNLTALAHLEWALKVLIGFEELLLSHSLICPSSCEERINASVESMLVTTESRVKKVSVLCILVILVIVIRCWLEPAMISSLLIQLIHSIVP